MFYGNEGFNQNLSSWSVSNVVDMTGTFAKASSFEGNGIDSWDVAQVKSMQGTFSGAKNMKAYLTAWKTSSCEVRQSRGLMKLFNMTCSELSFLY